jgi:SlyX protein
MATMPCGITLMPLLQRCRPWKRMMETRLNELEAKMSLAEDLLDALNRTVFHQQQQIDRLQQDIRALRQQLQEAAPDEFASPGDEIPPHY